MNIRLPLISFILRIGLAFAYIFIAILCFYNPTIVAEYTQPFMSPDATVLPILLGILALCMSAWILSGKMLFVSSSLSLLILFTILAINIDKASVIFASMQTLCLNAALILAQDIRKKKTPAPAETEHGRSAPAPTVIASAKPDPASDDVAETLL